VLHLVQYCWNNREKLKTNLVKRTLTSITCVYLMFDSNRQPCFRRCTKWKHIPDVAKGILENPDFKQTGKKLERLVNDLVIECDLRQKQLPNLEISNAKVLEQIQCMRVDVNKAFDELEAKTVAVLKTTKLFEEQIIHEDVDHLNGCIYHVQKKCADIYQKPKDESSAFICFKKCEQILQRGNSILQNMNIRTTNTQLTFQPSTGIIDYMSKQKQLGDVSVKGSLSPYSHGK